MMAKKKKKKKTKQKKKRRSAKVTCGGEGKGRQGSRDQTHAHDAHVFTFLQNKRTKKN
jgi:hypothetical protein